MRGAGGWGGDRGPSADVNVPPDRAPDTVVEEKTEREPGAALSPVRRLEPAARRSRASRRRSASRSRSSTACARSASRRAHVAQAFAPDGDPRYFKSIKVRFASTRVPRRDARHRDVEGAATQVVFRTQDQGARRGRASRTRRSSCARSCPKPKAEGRRRRAAARRRRAGADERRHLPRDRHVRRRQPGDRREGEDDVPVQADRPRRARGRSISTNAAGRGARGRGGKADCTLEHQRRRLHGDGDRQGRCDEAVLGGQAEDQRRRDGVAEARLPQEDRRPRWCSPRRRSAPAAARAGARPPRRPADVHADRSRTCST